MEYIVISETSLYDLKEIVNEKLTEGFKCQGGIAAANLLDKNYFFQAMIKDK